MTVSFFLGGGDAGHPRHALQVDLLNGRWPVHGRALLYSKTLAGVVSSPSVHAKWLKYIISCKFLNKRRGGPWRLPGWPGSARQQASVTAKVAMMTPLDRIAQTLAFP